MFCSFFLTSRRPKACSYSIIIQLLICETNLFRQQDIVLEQDSGTLFTFLPNLLGCQHEDVIFPPWSPQCDWFVTKLGKDTNGNEPAVLGQVRVAFFLFSPLFVTRVLYNDLIVFFVCWKSSSIDVGTRKSKKNSPKKQFRRRPLWGNRDCLSVLASFNRKLFICDWN